MKFLVHYADGRIEDILPSPADLVRFERHFDIPASKLDEDIRIEYVMFLAWTQLTRQGKEDRAFDDFLDALAEVGAGSQKTPKKATS